MGVGCRRPSVPSDHQLDLAWNILSSPHNLQRAGVESSLVRPSIQWCLHSDGVDTRLRLCLLKPLQQALDLLGYWRKPLRVIFV